VKLFGRTRRPVIDDPYIGRLTFTRGGYWEGELVVQGVPEKVGIVVPAPAPGPSRQQAAFCARMLGDLDALFARCRPVFEQTYEEWTSRKLAAGWRQEFSLVGLDLPASDDETRPWSACYFVPAANHYFTAFFEHGRASHATVDG
jgi:hypothetical protein